MKKGFKYLLNLLVVTALLVSTTGVTIYTHYCNSEGQVTSSLFVDGATCTHHHPAMHQHDCCQKKTACHTADRPGCCSDVKHLYKIDNTYDISDNQTASPEPAVLQLFDVQVFVFTTESESTFEKVGLPENPPPIPGKELIVRFLHLKISPDPLA